jgi:hypothetical protein
LDVLKRAGRLVLVIGIASILIVSTMQQVASANVADTHSTSLASRRSQLVDLARGEIGYQASPPGSNCAKYIDWWAGGPGNPDPCEAISSDGTQIRVVSGNNSNDLVSEQWYARSSSIFIGGNIPTFY